MDISKKFVQSLSSVIFEVTESAVENHEIVDQRLQKKNPRKKTHFILDEK